MLKLKDKVIVVTGSGGLLGGDIVNYLRNCGAQAISIDINQPMPDAYHRILDITNENAIKQCIKEIVADFGKIDGWVNCAYPRTSDWHNKLEDIPFDSWRKNIDMHLNGYYLCSKIILEKMAEQGFGSLVNMSSIYGVVGPDFSIYEGTSMTMPAAYSAIKGGIINLSRYFASYYGPFKLRVNCISPGGIQTADQPASFIKNYSKKVPLQRLGEPKDISPAVAFLLSDEASYITGHNLIIDGGWTAI